MSSCQLPLYGLDKELADRAAEKYDPQREQEAREYLETILQEPSPPISFFEYLKDGSVLCRYIFHF